MKGKIIIDITKTGVFSLDMRVDEMSVFDELCIVDALVEAFDCDEDERKLIGGCILMGGLKQMGMTAVRVDVPEKLADILRKKHNEENRDC